MNFKDYFFILTLFSILLLAILSPSSQPEFLEINIEEEKALDKWFLKTCSLRPVRENTADCQIQK